MAGSFPFKSLIAAAAPAVGAAKDFGRTSKDWAVQIATTGSPASFSVSLEGRLDGGAAFVALGSVITSAGLTTISGQLASEVRLNLTALTGGSSPTVTGTLAGY